MTDACERADACVEAGADAILIHSRDKTSRTSREQLGEKGFRVVIFANQTMRAAVQAMEQTLSSLAKERNATAVDPTISPVDHIFALVKTQEAIALEESLDRRSAN